MINTVDGFQSIESKAIELMNNVNKIIKIRSILDSRELVFINRVYILFVAYILFNKHFSKNTA